MPRGDKSAYTDKQKRMAEHIEDSAKREGRYRGREEEVAWATIHKEMSKREVHGKQRSRKS